MERGMDEFGCNRVPQDADRTPVENAQDLSAKASQYRELARRITDERAKDALLDLAEKCERLAQEKRDASDDQIG